MKKEVENKKSSIIVLSCSESSSDESEKELPIEITEELKKNISKLMKKMNPLKKTSPKKTKKLNKKRKTSSGNSDEQDKSQKAHPRKLS